jgi:hypothetical protein
VTSELQRHRLARHELDAVAVLSVFVVPDLQHHFTATWWIAASGTALAGVALMMLAPRARWDRLYWYPGGIAQRLSGEREPDIRLVRAHGPGRGVKVHLRPRTRGSHWVNLAGVPSGLIAHRVIEQAAAWFRIPVEVKEE